MNRTLDQKVLLVLPYHFVCPYCREQWQRGGHKEGFVKAAAMRHVYGCFTLKLWAAGYMDGGSKKGKAVLVTIDEAKKTFHPSAIRNIKALARRRKRESLLKL